MTLPEPEVTPPVLEQPAAPAEAPAAAPRVIRAKVLEPEPIVLEHGNHDVAGSRAAAADPVYRGAAQVRHLPAGMSGEDLEAEIERALAPGAIWRRGPLKVRIEKATPEWVKFREVSAGAAPRRIPRARFLTESRPA